MTAAVSAVTALMLVPLLPRALQLRSPRDLDRINRELAATLAEREDLLERYEREQNIATTFQSASLPSIPPRIGTLEISLCIARVRVRWKSAAIGTMRFACPTDE